MARLYLNSNGGYNVRYGTVFKISTNGALTTLYAFIGSLMLMVTRWMAHIPRPLVQGSDGISMARLPSAAGVRRKAPCSKSAPMALTSLYSFTGGNDGGYPYAGWCRAATAISMARLKAAGHDTGFCGDGGYGTVFKISTNGALTTLCFRFTGGNDGAFPLAGLVQGSDGFLYGTTQVAGGDGNGTVFQISTNGALTSLYSFTGGNDGGVSPSRAGAGQRRQFLWHEASVYRRHVRLPAPFSG
jgi:uncharacterized repeat protein (TIGR03803 family)